MGTVYRAECVAEGPAGPPGTVVAVKVFHPELVEEERALDRFRREAELGVRIRHPHVVRTYDFGCAEAEGRPWHFLSMEYVEGRTLASLLEELGTVPEQLRALIADQVLDALAAVHAEGVVHRDVKPENVVITAEHRVLVMDLGIARRQAEGETLTQAGEFVGSLAYAAPEQFRGGEDRLGPAADLYALGVVLFELATGRNPFRLDDLGTLLRQKLQEEAPRARSVRPEVEPFWDETIAVATKREPSERFASAVEMRRVLSEGEAGEWWRARAAKAARPAAERALQRLRLEREVARVGGDEALSRLSDAWGRARKGSGAVLVSGVSGVGKSRLVYDWIERLATDGGPSVAAVRAVPLGRSYEPVAEALSDLLLPEDADPARRRPILEDRLRVLLPDTPALAGPVADFLVGGVQPGVDGALSKDALLSACAQVFRRLADEKPLVVVVDDLHVAGPETVEAFRYAMRGAAGHPVLFVGLWTEDEVAEDSPLRAWAAARGEGAPQGLVVDALSDAATEELVRRVVRHERTVRALARPLFERGEGNPLLVLETLARLKTEGALVEREDGWDLLRPLDPLAVPRSVAELAASKVARLDDEQRETLEFAAVLGMAFDVPLLASVVGQNRIRLLQRLAVLERRHRLVTGAGATGYRFATRPLHEAVYAAIHPALRSEVHGVVADAILAARAGVAGPPDGPTAHALLRHLLHAGRALEAEPFLEAALEDVPRRLHASVAAPFLEFVAAAFAPAAPAKRLAIAMRLWNAYEFLASRADQWRVLETAADLAERIGEPSARARVCAYRAGSHWWSGDWAKAAAEAKAGLAHAREAGDRFWEATCLHTLGAIGYRLGDREECRRDLGESLRIRREIGDRRGTASTLQALGLVLKDSGRADEALAAFEEALSIWREIGERRGEAGVLTNLGTLLVDGGRPEEGLARYEKAIASHRETGALLSEALAFANAGRAHAVLGRLDSAHAAWNRALALFVEVGDPNGEIAVRIMLGASFSEFGRAAEARSHLEAALHLAERRGAKSKLAEAHREMGRLLHATGERPEAWTHFDRALALDGPAPSASRVWTLAAMGAAALAEGDPARAMGALTDAVEGARRAGPYLSAVVLARLARAQRDTGFADEAAAIAGEAISVVEASPNAISPVEAPEVYATLAAFLPDGPRRDAFLSRARKVTEERAARIPDDASRTHFLTRSAAVG